MRRIITIKLSADSPIAYTNGPDGAPLTKLQQRFIRAARKAAGLPYRLHRS